MRQGIYQFQSLKSLIPDLYKYPLISSLPSLPLSLVSPLPTTPQHIMPPQPQFTLMSPHYTIMPMLLPMTIPTPTLKPLNLVMVMPHQDLTELTFPMAVSKLLPTPLTKTDMSPMSNTKVLPNTLNTNPHLHLLTNPLIEQQL